MFSIGGNKKILNGLHHVSENGIKNINTMFQSPKSMKNYQKLDWKKIHKLLSVTGAYSIISTPTV